MHWLTFVAGAVLSWGVYGAMLHQGQVKLGNPMRALLCVGIAYFLIGVLVPIMVLMTQGQGLRGFNGSGTTFATVAGALGALGAVCIIFSFRTGGTPTYVMPLVFGGRRSSTCSTRWPRIRRRPHQISLCRLSRHRDRRRHGASFAAGLAAEIILPKRRTAICRRSHTSSSPCAETAGRRIRRSC